MAAPKHQFRGVCVLVDKISVDVGPMYQGLESLWMRMLGQLMQSLVGGATGCKRSLLPVVLH